MADPTHTERRLEGIRQCNIQIAAAKSGAAIPSLDTSFLSEDAFKPINGTNPDLDPLERYLKLDAQQEANVLYSRTATQNELAAQGFSWTKK